jgi:hypothetical protein
MEDAMRFYEWLLKMKNIHISDHNSMSLAYEKVIENSNESKDKPKRLK